MSSSPTPAELAAEVADLNEARAARKAHEAAGDPADDAVRLAGKIVGAEAARAAGSDPIEVYLAD